MSWKFLLLGRAGTSRSPTAVKKTYLKVANINTRLGEFTNDIKVIPIISSGEEAVTIGIMDKGRIITLAEMRGTPRLQETGGEESREEYHDFPPVRREEEIGYGDSQRNEDRSPSADINDEDGFYEFGFKTTETPTTDQQCK